MTATEASLSMPSLFGPDRKRDKQETKTKQNSNVALPYTNIIINIRRLLECQHMSCSHFGHYHLERGGTNHEKGTENLKL